MSFQNPSALWLLLGIPVLIVIWLIRPQHENRRVSSSYIWKLSDRFMKRRLPLSDLSRWLVFLLQLIVIAGGAFIAAKPVLNHGGKVDYLVILDSSASMRTKTETGVTRYDAAVKMIKDLAKETYDGHSVSVISASEKAGYLITDSGSRKDVISALEESSCGWGGSAISEAMTLAQLFIYEHPNAEVVLYTDQTVEEFEGISVVSLADDAWNAALTDLSVTSDGAFGCVISAILTSWGRDERISAGLSVNGKLIYAENYDCVSNEPVVVAFGVGDMRPVTSLEISIDPGDALDADNRIVYYSDAGQNCDTALISDSPLYISAALGAVNRGEATVIPHTAAQAALQTLMSDLYIFDGCSPDDYPVIGTILLVDPPALPSGLTAAGTSEESGRLIASAAGSRYKDRLLADMTLDGVSVSSHTVIDATDEWITVCSVGEDPVLLVRSNGIGQTIAVLAFDLHDSNLPLKSDFVSLIRNIINLAVPPLADRKIVTVGEKVTVTVPHTAQHLSITSPDGHRAVFGYEDEAEYTADTAGEYQLVCDDYETGFFAVIPPEEGHRQSIASLEVSREAAGNDIEVFEATSGAWKIIAAVVLIILLSEWGIYIYEQY